MQSTTLPDRVSGLLDYIRNAPTPYHAARLAARRLEAAGYSELKRGHRWDREDSRFGYVRPGDGALLAFDTRGGDVRNGVCILAAHTDSPALRIKEQGVSRRKGYLALPTEIYGGPIVSTWLDRPLGIAGRIAARDGSIHLFVSPHRVTIPNLAIHLNRKVNEGFEYNAQDHLVALASVSPGDADGGATELLRELAAHSAGREPADVSEVEAVLFDPEPGVPIGLDASLYQAPRVDNLAGCYTNLEAFLVAGDSRPRVLALYNHEEIGSQTGEGAQAGLIEQLLGRLVVAAGGDQEDVIVAMERSVVVSNDAGHALHPSYAEKYDPDYAPLPGNGPVLKVSGTYRYATTTASAAAFAAACERAGVPMQRLTNRSDIRSGSTVGPITWARTGIATVDVGLPLLAMHSIRETAGVADVDLMTRALVELINGG